MTDNTPTQNKTPELNTDFENIVPWNGANDFGRDVRLKWERNFEKLKINFLELITALADLDNFIRKDRPDGTSFLLSFGEFIDSLITGKGAGIYPDGRGQFSRLEVRDALVVMRLIINEIQAMAGDFSFSDAGCIEKVEDLGYDTYKLWMEKRTEYDVTNFTKNDIMYSIINNLLTGGTDYYTSWFRCLTKNVNDNTLTVVLYPDSEVPGGLTAVSL